MTSMSCQPTFTVLPSVGMLGPSAWPAVLALAIHNGGILGPGSLAVGKFADLVVLSDNPLEVPLKQLDQITVDSTYVGGRSVWQAGSE